MHRIVGDDDSHNLSDPDRPVLVHPARKHEIQDDPGIEFYLDSPVLLPDPGHPTFYQAAFRFSFSDDVRKPDLFLIDPQVEQRFCRYDPGRQSEGHLLRQPTG